MDVILLTGVKINASGYDCSKPGAPAEPDAPLAPARDAPCGLALFMGALPKRHTDVNFEMLL
ncbi:MAG: hypothetical protein ACLPT6_06715 [Desulfobaccales bacterium]